MIPDHPNAGAFLRLPPDRRPSNGKMLEALDVVFGGRAAVNAKVRERRDGPSTFMSDVTELWEEHCALREAAA